MILAEKISEERKKNGWSQEELADKLGVNKIAARWPAKAVAQFSIPKLKSSGNQVLIVVLLSHHNQQSNRIDITTAYEKIHT